MPRKSAAFNPPINARKQVVAFYLIFLLRLIALWIIKAPRLLIFKCGDPTINQHCNIDNSKSDPEANACPSTKKIPNRSGNTQTCYWN